MHVGWHGRQRRHHLVARIQCHQRFALAAADQQDQALVAERDIGKPVRPLAHGPLRVHLRQQMADQHHLADELGLVPFLQLGRQR